ncbi:LysM peptidoglycan-binding domain-containing protein [Salipiger sp.]|uniref:LysM peptidoglycan-binding domain-containing protein n=1 Tax=Salipiger sp. TaxID=2078585 RepID=UPI003A96DFE3
MQTKALGWGSLGVVAIAAGLFFGGVIGPKPGEVGIVVPAEEAASQEPVPGAAPQPQAAVTAPDAPRAPGDSGTSLVAAAPPPETAAAAEEPPAASAESDATAGTEPEGEGAGAAVPAQDSAAAEGTAQADSPGAGDAAAAPAAAAVPSDPAGTADAGPETDSAATQIAPSDPATPQPPRFDMVRAEPGGLVIVAGIAAPDARVAVLLDGAAQPWEKTDASGRFASLLDLPPATVARVLRLRMEVDGKEVESLEEVILAPAEQPAGEPSATGEPVAVASADTPSVSAGPDAATADTATTGNPAPEPAAPGASAADTRVADDPGADRTAPDVTAATETGSTAEASSPEATDAPATPDAPAPEVVTAAPGPVAEPAPGGAPAVADATVPAPAPGSAPQAPAVLLSTETGVEVMQPARPMPKVGVVIDAISYDDAGDVSLSGRGTDDGFVRIYLDNRALTVSRIAADGRWSALLPSVQSGTYTLRVDQVNATGKVTARAESPFLREDPERLAAAASLAGSTEQPVSAVTIQPGNTLWAIARGRYGEGMAYVRIYEANKDQIRNPDLIYPGQVFGLPE